MLGFLLRLRVCVDVGFDFVIIVFVFFYWFGYDVCDGNVGSYVEFFYGFVYDVVCSINVYVIDVVDGVL